MDKRLIINMLKIMCYSFKMNVNKSMYFRFVNKKIELEVLNVSQGYSQYHSYAVVLGELNGKRRLPIVIGAVEAQAIIVAIENMTPARPLTHDLLKNILDLFDIHLKEIIISNLIEGIFFSKLVCIKDGDVIEIDSRTSDAIALAIRFNAPIYIYDQILDGSGIQLEFEDEKNLAPTNPEEEHAFQHPSSYSGLNKSELLKLLEDAIQNEDYEKAAKIRDELKNKG